MKNYNEIIGTMLTALNVAVMKSVGPDNFDSLHMVTIHLPESNDLNPMRVLAPSIESGVGVIMDLYNAIHSAAYADCAKAAKLADADRTASNNAKLAEVLKIYHGVADWFQAGYFTIDGEPQKYSTNQTPFHYYFAKGRMSFEEMLNYAAVILNPDRITA